MIKEKTANNHAILQKYVIVRSTKTYWSTFFHCTSVCMNIRRQFRVENAQNLFEEVWDNFLKIPG